MKPDYWAQTFEPDNTASPEAARAWFNQRAEEAKERGCKSARASHTDEKDGLLFEAWKTGDPSLHDPEPSWAWVAAD